MMTELRQISNPRIGLSGNQRPQNDPRMGLPGDARSPTDPRSGLTDRGMLSVCNCGLPNCPRVPHHPGSHAMTLPQEGHLAATHGFPGLPLGAAPIDPAVLYQMGAAYGLGENPDMIRSLPQLNGYYPYDPTDVYPYMNGYAGIDARRKNATKESTNTLKAWLFEHRKNPYPTKGEKIMLAILTKMTLTQVSTWFANARRRLKKENKVTWVTKDGDTDDDDDDVDSEHNSDVTDQANVSGNSAGGDPKRPHGSLDDDDNFSLISGGDPSEIDVEEHNEIGDEDHRVPPMIPHGIPPVYLSNHGQHTQTSSLTDKMSLRTEQSATRDSSPNKDTNIKSECSHTELSRSAADSEFDRSSSILSPVPTSPDVIMLKQSQSAERQPLQPVGNTHKHPVTSPSSMSSSTSIRSSSSPTKPKIWSIADVVSSCDSSKSALKPEATSPEGTSPRTRSPGHVTDLSVGAASHVLSPGGLPGRPGLSRGIMIPDGPQRLTYFPYGLPHAALMTPHVTSHIRIPHPYARSTHALAGHRPDHLSHTIPSHDSLLSQYNKLIQSNYS